MQVEIFEILEWNTGFQFLLTILKDSSPFLNTNIILNTKMGDAVMVMTQKCSITRHHSPLIFVKHTCHFKIKRQQDKALLWFSIKDY